MERSLHFATKLNSRDIQTCNCFWVPSYDQFASARKAVFPAPTATGFHRLRNTWSSLWEVICHKKFQQYFLNQRLPPPPPHPVKNSLIRPWVDLFLAYKVKNSNWPEANQLAIYKGDRGFELGTTENKSSERSGRALNAGLRITIPALLTADHFTYLWNCPPTLP